MPSKERLFSKSESRGAKLESHSKNKNSRINEYGGLHQNQGWKASPLFPPEDLVYITPRATTTQLFEDAMKSNTGRNPCLMGDDMMMVLGHTHPEHTLVIVKNSAGTFLLVPQGTCLIRCNSGY